MDDKKFFERKCNRNRARCNYISGCVRKSRKNSKEEKEDRCFLSRN